MINHKTEELFTIKDDVVDPSGRSQLRGRSYEYRMDRNKIECPVRWEDRLLIVDVYEADGQLMLVLYCPKCEQTLRILSTAKQMDFCTSDRRLDVEMFACASYPVCDWRVHIKRNVAKNI